MQNSSLPPLAQVLDEELIQGPPEEAPTLDEGLIRGPSDPPTEVEPFPVQEAEVSPRNWVVDALGAFFTSPNHAKSIQENVLDTLKLFLPAGPRASGKWTAVPGVADLTRLIAEAGVVSSRYRAETTLGTGTPPIKAALEGIFRGYMEVDERLFGGAEQEGDETPMFDAFADYITGRYDFRQPAVRAAFSQVVREDPWGVLTDLMTIPSLAFGGAGIGTRAATTSAKVSARMSKILGIPQKLNRAFNQGFHLPLVPRLLPAPVKRRMQSRISEGKFKGGKFEFKTGIADGLDPGVWAVRGAGRAISAGARRIPYSRDTQPSQQTALVRQGFSEAGPETIDNVAERAFAEARLGRPPTGPLPDSTTAVDAMFNMLDRDEPTVTSDEAVGIFTPLSLQNSAEGLLDIEARRFDNEYPPLVEAVERSEAQLNLRVREIVEKAHEDGDLTNLAVEMSEAFTTARQDANNLVKERYADIGAEPGLVIDMRPVYTKLQELQQQDLAAARLSADPTAGEIIPFADDRQLRNLNTNIDQAASQNLNLLNPDFLSGQESAPTQPRVAQTGATASQVEDDLFGTATRNSVDLNTGQEYGTTYRLMELDDVLTSHDLTGAQTAGYDAALQVKDMSDASSLRNVQRMAGNFRPDFMLGSNRSIQQGAPILNSRSMTISGNHRMNALRVVYDRHPTAAAQYRTQLHADVERFGLTGNPDDMRQPVLVRVLDDDLGTQGELALARAANVSDVAQLSETAQATQDLHLVSDDMFQLFNAGDGRTSIQDLLDASDNRDFVNTFVNKLADTEKPQFIGEGDALRQGGKRRIINALTAKIFSGTYGAAMRATFTEIPTAGFKNIQRGIEQALPALIRLRSTLGDAADRLSDSGIDYDLSESLALSIQKIRELMEDSPSGSGVQRAINTYLSQETMAVIDDATATAEGIGIRRLDDTERKLLQLVALGVRRPSFIRDFLRDYASSVVRQTESSVDAAYQRSLLGDEGDVMVPREEFVDTLVSKYVGIYEEGVGEDLRKGLDEFFQGDETPDETPDAASAASTRAAPIGGEPVTAARPILYENVVAYRDALERAVTAQRGNRAAGKLNDWRVQVIDALDDGILQTLIDAFPDRAEAAAMARQMKNSTRDWLNSNFARTLAELTDSSRNPNDPAVQKAMNTFFTPGDTPSAISDKYKLLGGFNSEASQRVRRAFLDKLFGFIRTPSGTADAGAVARGDAPVGDVSGRYRPDGVTRYMNEFMKESVDYSQETLIAILGERTVNDLNDLDIILQSFGRFMQSTRKNQSFFGGEGAVYRNVMSRVANNLGGNLFRGAVGGGAGVAMGGVPGAVAGSVLGFLGQWLGSSAASAAFNSVYGTKTGKRVMLDGIELSMRESWRAGARVLLRSGRTASKREEE